MPNENQNAAETTVNNVTDDGKNADTIDNNENTDNDVNDASFTDDNDSGTDEGKQTQSKEQNSQNARRRREAERQAEINNARNQAIIDALDGINPYTNEEMKDALDVEEYLAMKEIKKNGGDPVGDYAKIHKQKQREKAEKDKQEAQSQEWYANDRKDFAKKHPNVDINKLSEDANFVAFAGQRVGKEPLATIYSGYLELAQSIEKNIQNKNKQQLANANATPGALSTTGTGESEFFTKEQVQKMTSAEIRKNYEKIRKSQEKW